VLVTTPTYAVLMAEAAKREEIHLADIPLRFMWLTGEGCSPAFRERVEAIWGHPAYFYYGSLELGPIGIECEQRNGYHIAGGHVYVEVVSPATGLASAPGEIGEIVVTELTRMASPLIRYKTGDLGYIEEAPCPCGIPLRRVVMRGRAGDQVEIGEQSFGPYYLEQFLMQIPEVGNWYQFLPKRDRLLIKVEPADGVAASPRLGKAVESQFEYATGLKAEVQFVEKMPRSGGKTLRVIYETT
jgi:phenylacetate-CoA ligase